MGRDRMGWEGVGWDGREGKRETVIDAGAHARTSGTRSAPPPSMLTSAPSVRPTVQNALTCAASVTQHRGAGAPGNAALPA